MRLVLLEVLALGLLLGGGRDGGCQLTLVAFLLWVVLLFVVVVVVLSEARVSVLMEGGGVVLVAG